MNEQVQQGSEDPTFGEALKVWAKIGILSFGGPTAQIALMHKILVDEKKWLTENQYLGALSFCMLLPGPEAMQLATYAGWRRHGVMGGLAAGLLFVLPGAFVVLALATIYAFLGNVPLVAALFLGVKAAVAIIVVEALLRIAKRALKLTEHWIVAGHSFVAIFFFAIPFPIIVVVAALFGAWRGAVIDDAEAAPELDGSHAAKALGTTLKWLAIWLLPLVFISWWLGYENVFSQIGWFFSKLAVVTFGGAYAVLAYMAQDVVTGHGWLTAGQMMDGLGLAETTPGPLILVTEFVAFLTGFQHGGFAEGAPAWWAGVAGAAISLWATFAPCFLFIFVGAPYIAWINTRSRLKSALTGITASVVGVIFNLALWFALHVFFGQVNKQEKGVLVLWTPVLETLDWQVFMSATILAVTLTRF